MLERRQQRIAELQIKHQGLKAELEEAKTRLVLRASRWSGECEYHVSTERAQTHGSKTTNKHWGLDVEEVH